MKYQVEATWPLGMHDRLGNRTTDVHVTREKADEVARQLRLKGAAGKGVLFPTSVNVTPIFGEGEGRTVVHYMYRDASNYKTHRDVILQDRLSPAQEKLIREIMEASNKAPDSDCFIPSEVGLDDLQENLQEYDEYDNWDADGHYVPYDDQDHVWHEWQGTSLTDRPASTGLTALELVKAFKKVRETDWDDVGTLARLVSGHPTPDPLMALCKRTGTRKGEWEYVDSETGGTGEIESFYNHKDGRRAGVVTDGSKVLQCIVDGRPV